MTSRPARHFAAQVVGADVVRQRGVAQGGAVQHRQLRGGAARGRQAVVETLAPAGRSRHGRPCRDARRPCRARPVRARAAGSRGRWRGSLRSASSASWRPGVFAARKNTLSMLLAGRRFQHREQAADGLADAGRRLRQHAAPAAVGAEDGLGQVALAGAEIGMRETAARLRAASRAARCASSCAAQATKRSHWLGEHARPVRAALAVSRSTVSVWLAMSKYTSARLTCSSPRAWHSRWP